MVVVEVKNQVVQIIRKTRIDVYETLCPQQMLVHKGGQIKNWGWECRDVTRMFGEGGCHRVTERRIEVFVKIQKKKLGGGGQGGCDRRIEVFGKIHKKKGGGRFGGGGGRFGGGGGFGGQGGCE